MQKAERELMSTKFCAVHTGPFGLGGATLSTRKSNASYGPGLKSRSADAPTLFLLLIRCSLPRLEIRRASKWTAALEYADEQKIARNDYRPSYGVSVG